MGLGARGHGQDPREGRAASEGLVHDACRQHATKRRQVPLELAQLRPEARLPPIRGPHPQWVIAAGQIELGEDSRPPCAVEQRVDGRERLGCWPAAARWR